MSAYIILDLSIHNFDEFSEYIEKIPEFISKHEGKYIVRGEIPVPLEGGWKPERMVVIEFPSKEKVDNFISDPDVQPLFDLRKRTTISKSVIVDGCR